MRQVFPVLTCLFIGSAFALLLADRPASGPKEDSNQVQLTSVGVPARDTITRIAKSAARVAPPQATAVEQIKIPQGFKIELLYSVPKTSQGSWVSLTSGPKGRLYVSDQNGGLFRVTPGANAETTKVEKLDLKIGDAQGLLWAFDSLYVTVNGGAAQGSGFYRCRDTNGDGELDNVKLLKKLAGGGEHGPHGIRLGRDGKLYVIAGNHTKIPGNIDPRSPHRNWAEDLLLPRNPDGGGHANGIMAPGGWIARTDKDGKNWELFCAGFRNAYDIDFNQDGELFTFDADMEWDTGAPWYRPTRVNHAVSAAEHGWRYGTGKWPDYFADSLGSVVDIGLGSPTGICFGTGAKFSAKYQRALYINDWTYGKIYAVHMRPDGSSYTADFETFIEAKPLPVTDICVSIDGGLYFTIGGRGTQSGLYRVTYTGDESTAPVGAIKDPAASKARALRHKIEAFHTKQDPAAIRFVWPYLNSSDRNIRYAARVALERQDPKLWQKKALAERRPTVAIQCAIALCRAGDKQLQPRVIAMLNGLPYSRMNEEQTVGALRAYGLSFIRHGKPNAKMAESVLAKIDSLFPQGSDLVNHELCRVLVYLEAPTIVDRTMKLLTAAQTQQEQFHYAFLLRNVGSGWTTDQRKAYFSWLNLAQTKYRGGNSFKRAIGFVRNNAVEKLTDKEKVTFKKVIEGSEKVASVEVETTRQFIHNWQLSDLLPELDKVESGRSYEKGKIAFKAAQCFKCHRFDGEGGATGPDLTGVGNRFTAQYIIEAVVEPSKVISDQYIQSIIQLDSGEVVTGRVLSEDDDHVLVRTDPYSINGTKVDKDSIEQRKKSTVSEMSRGAINVLTKEEVLDLVAYMRSGGKPDDKAFQKKSE